MRAYSWMALGGMVVACGGSAFKADEANGSAGSGNDVGDGGVLNFAGRGGSLIGSGGKKASAGETSAGGSGTSGGAVGVAGDLGIAGDLVAGGSVGSAGEPGTAGTGMTEPDTTCPATQPAKGATCEGALSCGYGKDVRTQCRTRANCHSGAWQIDVPVCSELQACGSTVNAGSTCDANAAAPCVKDAFQYCSCSPCEGNVCMTKAIWHCLGGSSSMGCPKLAPNQGQGCDNEISCSYGGCGLGQGQPEPIQATCNGTWSYEANICIQ